MIKKHQDTIKEFINKNKPAIVLFFAMVLMHINVPVFSDDRVFYQAILENRTIFEAAWFVYNIWLPNIIIVTIGFSP